MSTQATVAERRRKLQVEMQEAFRELPIEKQTELRRLYRMKVDINLPEDDPE